MLRREGWSVNAKRVRRLMADTPNQGVQHAATAYTDLLAGRGVGISVATVGTPEENGFAERLMRNIREEEIDLPECRDFAEAYGKLGKFLDDVYNRKRIQSALGYLRSASKSSYETEDSVRRDGESSPVLLVTHLFQPLDGLPGELFMNGDVCHGRGRRCPMPMLLTRRKPDHVTRPDLLDRPAPTLCPAAAGRNKQGLS
jgi:hypothetical protein